MYIEFYPHLMCLCSIFCSLCIVVFKNMYWLPFCRNRRLLMSSGHAISIYALSATSVVLYLSTLPIQLNAVLSAQKIDYCNSLLFSIPISTLQQLQRVQKKPCSCCLRCQQVSTSIWRPTVWVTLAINQTTNPLWNTSHPPSHTASTTANLHFSITG